MASSTKDLSTMAPKGHWYTHAPQEMHFLLSMTAFLSSPTLMALTLQEVTQGRFWWMMAPYGHACVHLPHSMHLDLSTTALWSMIWMASLGHASWQRWTMQPRQAGVTKMPPMGHSSQAMSMTSTTLGLFLSPPCASLMRSCTMARSLKMQQRMVALGPGEISLGISVQIFS